jgi:hypothetical protein
MLFAYSYRLIASVRILRCREASNQDNGGNYCRQFFIHIHINHSLSLKCVNKKTTLARFPRSGQKNLSFHINESDPAFDGRSTLTPVFNYYIKDIDRGEIDKTFWKGTRVKLVLRNGNNHLFWVMKDSILEDAATSQRLINMINQVILVLRNQPPAAVG